MKKAECIISVTKDCNNSLLSEVSCDYIRGAMEFDKFNIIIDNGIPKVDPDFKANVSKEPTPFYEKVKPEISIQIDYERVKTDRCGRWRT